MKKILDVKYPIVDCYPSTGHALAILQCHDEMEGWILSNFVQLFGTDEYTIDYFDFDVYNCPFINYGEISFSVVSTFSTYRDFIVKMINDGYYVSVYVESSMLKLYNLDVGLHQLFIYGYDLEKKVFYCGDHFINGKYSFQICDIDDVLAAIQNYRDKEKIGNLRGERFIDDYFCFQFYRFDISRHRIKIKFLGEIYKEFYIDRLKQSLFDYLNGDNTVNWCTRMNDMPGDEKKRHKWGIQVYDILKKHVDYVRDYGSDTWFGRQSFYTIYNHKVLMRLRIEYLEREGYIEKNLECNTLIGELIEETHQMCMLFLKCSIAKNLSHKEMILDRLYEKLAENREKEILFTRQLLRILSKRG